MLLMFIFTFLSMPLQLSQLRPRGNALFHQHLTFPSHLERRDALESKKCMFECASDSTLEKYSLLNWPLWCDQLLIANWLRCWVDTKGEMATIFRRFSNLRKFISNLFFTHITAERRDGREKFAKKNRTHFNSARKKKSQKTYVGLELFSCEAHRHDIYVLQLLCWRSWKKKKIKYIIKFSSLTLVALIRRWKEKKFKWISQKS